MYIYIHISNGNDARGSATRHQCANNKSTLTRSVRNSNEAISSRCVSCNQPPTLLTLFSTKKKASRSDTRLDQTCRCVFFFFRLLIVLFYYYYYFTRASRERKISLKKKKKEKASERADAYGITHQCTVAHVRENT